MKIYLISDLIFFITLGSGMIVLILAFILFRILKLNHIDKYNSMGKPSILFGRSFKIFGSTSKFLFKREHKELGNNKLSMISDLMVVLIIIYNIGILSWVALIFYQAP